MNIVEGSLPPLEVKVTDFNRSEHLDNVVSRVTIWTCLLTYRSRRNVREAVSAVAHTIRNNRIFVHSLEVESSRVLLRVGVRVMLWMRRR